LPFRIGPIGRPGRRGGTIRLKGGSALMAAIPDQGGSGFRLSMLINDTRYRSLTIQVIAFLLFIFAVGYLLNNALTNLAAQGQTFSFRFLGQVAGYDINQRLIDYNSQMSHARAAMVGVLNTLLIAFLGCIAATVIGVVAGILRLSSNWLVARIMSAYVEIFRNIPVLIVILTIYAVMTETMPAPNAFRGENATASMILWDSVAVTNRGIYVPRPIFAEGSMVVVLTFLASIVGVFAFGRYAKRRLYATGELLPTLRIQLAILILPTLVMFFLLGRPISLEVPELRGFNFVDGVHLRGPFIALWFALSIYTAAFIAENVRAGIQSVSRGQSEAAASLGLRPNFIMRLVILPQALRVIVPPLISHYLNLTKNSSLAIAVGYMDVTATTRITLNQTGRAIEAILLLMAFYLVISLSISAFMNWYNARIKLKER
jgi:general L-amino acid transport system permease protein